MKNFNIFRSIHILILLLASTFSLQAQLPNLVGNGSTTFNNSNPCILTGTFGFTNNGLDHAGSFTVGLYLTTDQFAADPDFDILADEVTAGQGLLIGDNLTYAFSNIPISNLVQSGQVYYVYVYLDTNDDVTESNEQDNLNFIGNTVCSTVGITDPGNSQASIHISPNPTSDQVQIQVENIGSPTADLSIYDAQGRLVHSETKLQAIQGELSRQLDLSTWSRGLYHIQLNTPDHQISQKLILK